MFYSYFEKGRNHYRVPKIIQNCLPSLDDNYVGFLPMDTYLRKISLFLHLHAGVGVFVLYDTPFWHRNFHQWKHIIVCLYYRSINELLEFVNIQMKIYHATNFRSFFSILVQNRGRWRWWRRRMMEIFITTKLILKKLNWNAYLKS